MTGALAARALAAPVLPHFSFQQEAVGSSSDPVHDGLKRTQENRGQTRPPGRERANGIPYSGGCGGGGGGRWDSRTLGQGRGLGGRFAWSRMPCEEPYRWSEEPYRWIRMSAAHRL